jgi:hypothetical protein
MINGILIHDTSLSLSSDTTPVGPLPGRILEPDGQDSELVLEASGTIQGDTSPSLDLRIARAGLPGTVQILWKDQADSVFYGWDSAHVSHAERVLIQSTDTYRPGHAIRLASGDTLAVVSVNNQEIKTVKPGASPVSVYSRGSPVSSGILTGTLYQSPSGRVFLYHWIVEGGRLQIRAWRSDDSGDSWDLAQTYCLEESLSTTDYQPGRLRVARLGESLLLVAHCPHSTPEDRLLQWASVDQGCSWRLVSEVSGESRGYPELIVAADQIRVVYLAYRSASAPNVLPYSRVLTSAWEQLASAEAAPLIDISGLEWGSVSGSLLSGELALWAEPGVVWIVGREETSNSIPVFYSTDGGDSFSACGQNSRATSGSATVWNGGSATLYPESLALCPLQGGLLLLYGWSGGADPDSLHGLELGGYRPASWPFLDSSGDDFWQQASPSQSWLPVAVPTALNAGLWTASSSGTPIISLVPGGLALESSGPADTISYIGSVSSSLTQGVLIECFVSPKTGKAFIDAFLVAGGSRYGFRAYYSAGSWVLRDLIAGSDSGSVSVSGVSNRQRMILALSSAGAWLQVISDDAAGGGEQLGTVSATPTASAGGSSSVQWGILSGGSAGARSDWHGVYFSDGSDTGLQLSSGQALSERQGKILGGDPVWLTSGLLLAARAGVGLRGQTWEVSPQYRFDTTQIDPIAGAYSSSRPGRWATAPALVWSWSDSAARLPAGLVAIYLERFNFRYAEIEYHDGSSWVSLGTVDLAAASSLSWSRSGGRILARHNGTPSRYFVENELAGGYFIDSGARLWLLSSSSGGRFPTPSAGETGQKMRIELASALSGDPHVGAAGAILPPKILITLPVDLLGTEFEALRLTPSATDAAISDPDSGEDYYQIGTAIIGSLFVFGRKYSWGRVSEIQLQGDQYRARSGQLLSASRRGGPIRAVEFSWNDGQDERPLSLSQIPTLDFSGESVATPGAVLQDLSGALERVGKTGALVYIARLTEDNFDTIPLSVSLPPSDLIYGVLASDIFRSDTVLGEEGEEVRRGGTLRIEEVG